MIGVLGGKYGCGGSEKVFPGDTIREVLEEGKSRKGKFVSKIVKVLRKEYILTTGCDSKRARQTELCQGEGNVVDGSGNVAPEKHTRGHNKLTRKGKTDRLTRMGVINDLHHRTQ